MHSYTIPIFIPSPNSFSGLGMRLRIRLDLASRLGLGYQWVWVETVFAQEFHPCQSYCCSSSTTSNWSSHTSKPARPYQVQTAVSEPEPPGTGFCSPAVSAWSCTVGSCLGREGEAWRLYNLLPIVTAVQVVWSRMFNWHLETIYKRSCYVLPVMIYRWTYQKWVPSWKSSLLPRAPWPPTFGPSSPPLRLVTGVHTPDVQLHMKKHE